MDFFSRFTMANPSCDVTLKDNFTSSYKKTGATMALVWYNLTLGADAQWRKRWYHHLLGHESSVLLWQSLFDKEDAVVCLSVGCSTSKDKQEEVCHSLSK
jgi:hypothetical protein